MAMDPIDYKSYSNQLDYLKQLGYSEEAAKTIIAQGEYKSAANIRRGTGTGNVNVAPGTIKNDYSDMSKANKAVEDEAKRIQKRSAVNASDKSQPNLVGTTASDPKIGKPLEEVAAENRNETLDKIGAVGLKTDIQPEVKTAGVGGGSVPPNTPNTPSVSDSETQAVEEKVEEVGENATTPKEKQAYGKSMSIISAWRNGVFGDPESEDAKERRNYFIMDALATASRNMANDFGRVAAAYGGGTYSGENVSSQWEDRNRELNEAAVSAEEAGVEGSDKAVERQSIALEQKAQELSNMSRERSQEVAKTVLAAMYEKNPDGSINMGRPIYDLRDPAEREVYTELATLLNEIQNGGGEQNDWKAILTKAVSQLTGEAGKGIRKAFGL